MRQKCITPEELQELLNKGLSPMQIARLKQVTVHTIHYYGSLYKISLYPDYTGYRLLYATVLKKIKSKNRKVWRCLCDCGTVFDTTPTQIKNGSCKSCGCSYKGPTHPHYKGYEKISLVQFNEIKTKAKDRNLDFDISMEYIWNLYNKQDRKCALTGIPIVFVLDYTKNRKLTTASLDRINSNLGYIQNNVQWVHKDINRMKWAYSEDDFIRYCTLVSQNRAGLLCEYTNGSDYY